jgi:nicotinamidase-related amidase
VPRGGACGALVGGRCAVTTSVSGRIGVVKLSRTSSTLVLVDLQERLMPAIAEADSVLANAARLAKAAAALGVGRVATEQAPRGLGPTVEALTDADLPVVAKTSFDAAAVPELAGYLPDAGCVAVVAGAETHVCVLQTVLGLLSGGWPVAVVADAVGSRTAANRQAALERMRAHGADVVTTEMVLFEWLGDSETPEFRAVHQLIK